MGKKPVSSSLDVVLRSHDAAVVIAAERVVVSWADKAGVLAKVEAPTREHGKVRIHSNEHPMGEDFRGKIHVRRIRLRGVTEAIVEDARNLLLPLAVETTLRQVEGAVEA